MDFFFFFFLEGVDNSTKPFIPKIKHKPFGRYPLDLFKPNEHPFGKEMLEESQVISVAQLSPNTFIPPAPEETKCEWVGDYGEFSDMCFKLSGEPIIAIDLEQHTQRSYQGFTCLMQISIPYVDYVIDTIALRQYMHDLSPIFACPNAIVVIHGEDDTLWLQRDFGLYPRNVFNTQRAARELGLGLSYYACVQHYFNVQLNKDEQTADWRTRPLTEEMLEYARSDTHYLLPMYALMKRDLIAKSKFNVNADLYHTLNNVLFDVVAQSRASNLRVYKKPSSANNPLTDQNFKSGMLEYFQNGRTRDKEIDAIMIALFHWRDKIARELDESISYIMGKGAIFEIAYYKASTLEEIKKYYNPVPEMVGKLDEICEVINSALFTARNGTPAAVDAMAAANSQGVARMKIDADSAPTVPSYLDSNSNTSSPNSPNPIPSALPYTTLPSVHISPTNLPLNTSPTLLPHTIPPSIPHTAPPYLSNPLSFSLASLPNSSHPTSANFPHTSPPNSSHYTPPNSSQPTQPSSPNSTPPNSSNLIPPNFSSPSAVPLTIPPQTSRMKSAENIVGSTPGVEGPFNYEELSKEAPKSLHMIYQAHFGSRTPHYEEKSDGNTATVKLMVNDVFLVTLRDRQERERYGKIEIYASSKEIAKQYAALVACVFIASKITPKPTQAGFKTYWEKIKKCEYATLVQWLCNKGLMRISPENLPQPKNNTIVNRPTTSAPTVTPLPSASSTSINMYTLPSKPPTIMHIPSIPPTQSPNNNITINNPIITTPTSPCTPTQQQTAYTKANPENPIFTNSQQINNNYNYNNNNSNSFIPPIQFTPKINPPVTPPLSPNIIPPTITKKSTPPPNKNSPKSNYVIICKHCHAMLCAADLLFAKNWGVHSYDAGVLQNVTVQDHPDRAVDENKLNKLHCKECNHSVGNIMLEGRRLIYSFKKIDTLFRRIDLPQELIDPNQWITLKERKTGNDSKPTTPSLCALEDDLPTGKKRPLSRNSQNAKVSNKKLNSSPEWFLYKLGLEVNQRKYDHLQGRTFGGFLLFSQSCVITRPFSITRRKDFRTRCTPEFLQRLTLTEAQVQELVNICSTFVKPIQNFTLEELHAAQIYALPYMTPFDYTDMPSYFSYLATVLEPKPALQVMLNILAKTSNATGLPLTFDNLARRAKGIVSNEMPGTKETMEEIAKVFSYRVLLTKGVAHKVVTSVNFTKNPHSQNFDGRTFAEYYLEKNIPLQNLEQPIINTKSEPIPFTTVIPSPESSQMFPDTPESSEKFSEFIPEITFLSGITMEMYYAELLLPSVLANLKKSTLELAKLQEFQRNLGFSIQDPNLLKKVFTTSGAANSDHQADWHYENEEFLGDAVLELVLSHYLFVKYNTCDEGKLTNKREKFAANAFLQSVAIGLGFREQVIVAANTSVQDSQISDVLEAFIGALFLEGGLKLAAKFILKFILDDESFDFFALPPTPQCTTIKPKPHQLEAMLGVQKKIQYTFTSQPLLIEAFTHATVLSDNSYKTTATPPTYQRLEFLGDALFKFVAGVHLYTNHKEESVGNLTVWRIGLNSGTSQVKMAEEIGIPKALLTGDSYQEDAIKSPKSDALEALVGAVYLETGIDASCNGCCENGDGNKVIELLHYLFSLVSSPTIFL
eukprot:Phypoly_transcript_00388.p1 GENE.Phypoly_transcript_00388~~Phypoly_transcript_00388.p1  ORF type:complete len:1653 (+),score=260.29 Phypoly_transcript_00388:53-4960(+)